MPTTAMAMVTPGPQAMTIVVINAPEDLAISIVHYEELEIGDNWLAREFTSRRLWETYHRFPLCTEPAGFWPYDDITILVNSQEYGAFELTFPVPGRRSFAVRLDMETQTVTAAYSHVRNLIIALCWLVPLFATDSMIFSLFGHRQKRSWKVFALTNLAMQGLFLGIWSLFHIFFAPHIFLAVMTALFIPGARVVKWNAEYLVCKIIIDEHSRARGTACVAVMNLIGIFIVILLGIHIPLPAL